MNADSPSLLLASLRRYLLGLSPESERDQLEDAVFSRDEILEQIDFAEDDLIESYLRGNLSEPEVSAFKTFFLKSPDRRRQLEISRAMRTIYSLRESEPAPSRDREQRSIWHRFMMPVRMPLFPAAAVALLLLLGVWMGSRLTVTTRSSEELAGLRDQLSRTEQRLRREQARGEELARETERLRMAATTKSQPAKTSPVFSFLLAPGNLRDGEPKRLAIPPDADRLDVTLESDIPSDFRKFRVIIRRSSDGAELWSKSLERTAISRDGSSITVTLPSSILPKGDYLLTLSGAADGKYEVLNDYSFRMAGK